VIGSLQLDDDTWFLDPVLLLVVEHLERERQEAAKKK
jgi:hypothetical protein